MNDEIKKILRDLDFASGVFDYTLTPDRCTLLKDYITILQQELETTNEKWEKDKQFDNCRLKENVELRKENDYLTNELNTCMIERNKYVSRVEKAVESLKIKQIRYVNESDYVIDDGDLQEEINILQGEQNEQ